VTFARGPFDEVGGKALVGGLLIDGPLAHDDVEDERARPRRRTPGA
jgi:hypothetical protein